MSDLILKSDAINAIMSCPSANPEYPLYFAEKIKSVPTIQQKQDNAMNHVKKYVIEKEGYDTIVVNLTEREAMAIEKFVDWACLDDDFYIESVEEYEADEWGSDGTN